MSCTVQLGAIVMTQRVYLGPTTFKILIIQFTTQKRSYCFCSAMKSENNLSMAVQLKVRKQ